MESKSIKQVGMITGVTRKALQGYESVGLLKKTGINQAGHWQYNELALKRLMFIQIFRKLGYKRKEILDLLNTPVLNFWEELDRAIGALQKKRDEMDGLITWANSMRMVRFLSKKTIEQLNKVDFSKLYAEKNMNDYIDEFIKVAAETPREEVELSIRLAYTILEIGGLRPMHEGAVEVQHTIGRFFNLMVRLESLKWDKVDVGKLASQLLNDVEDLVDDNEYRHMLELFFGVGIEDYVKRAFFIFKANKG